MLQKVIKKLRVKNDEPKWHGDEEFSVLYDKEAERCNTPGKSNARKRRRKYLMLEFLRSLTEPEGDIVECGCFLGISSRFIAYEIEKFRKAGKDTEFHIFDSFEGLSEGSNQDTVEKNDFEKKGLMSCSLENVKSNLSDFDFIKYYKGWIPTTFKDVDPDKKFSFVHIDVDLYDPIKDSLEFFYPKLTAPGYIVVDDYKSARWPGVEKAVEEFVKKHNATCIRSTVGLAIIVKNS